MRIKQFKRGDRVRYTDQYCYFISAPPEVANAIGTVTDVYVNKSIGQIVRFIWDDNLYNGDEIAARAAYLSITL